jgi:hypothetical protein
MSHSSIEAETEFDAYAAEYDEVLARGISISGEDKNYFARCRIDLFQNSVRTPLL